MDTVLQLIAAIDWSSALASQCDLLQLLVNGGVEPNEHLQFVLQKTVAAMRSSEFSRADASVEQNVVTPMTLCMAVRRLNEEFRSS